MATSPDREIFVILNPAARGERARAMKDYVQEISAQASIKLTSSPGEAGFLAKRAVERGARIIVAAGGDGTINEVVNGIANTQASLGILPAGTMNVFALELGIPFDLEEAWEIILRGRTRTIDLPRAGNKSFVQMAGVGLDAQTVKETTREFKKLFGPLSYVFNVIRIAAQKQPHITVTLKDGSTHVAAFVLIGNGRFYGGPFPMFKEASLDDGLLEVYLFKSHRHWNLIRYFTTGSLGLIHFNKDVVHLKTDQVTFDADREVAVEIDGELIGQLPITFSISPKSLKVIVP